jgi:hypothetical protein
VQSVLSFLQVFFSNPQYYAPATWVVLGFTVAWILISAKRLQEISAEEAEILWKAHKQFDNCCGNKFTTIYKGKKDRWFCLPVWSRT